MSTVKRVGGAAGAVCAVGAIIAIVLSNGQVRTNQRGLELIGNAEGCRRDPYTCPAGVITDGIGNTHGVQPGTRKNNEQIAADWQKNILDAEACVNRSAGGDRLPDNAFSAAVSTADIIVELPYPWDSWLDIIVTGFDDGRDPESLPRVP